MNNHPHIQHQHFELGVEAQLILAIPFVISLFLYIIAVVHSNHKYRKWPIYRTIYYLLGVSCAVAATIGPIAVGAHHNFTLHMVGHLLLGMLAPLLIVLAEPMTLFMRTINVTMARRLFPLLRGKLAQLYIDPVFTSLFNIGGLWLIYTTSLYTLMHQNVTLHILIHIHVFLAGYLFTVSMIDMSQVVHKVSFLYRSIVLVFALAGHGILAKYIYVFPPSGVPSYQAEMGSMLMYYGGDVIDMIIILILCMQWYRSTRPRNFAVIEHKVF